MAAFLVCSLVESFLPPHLAVTHAVHRHRHMPRMGLFDELLGRTQIISVGDQIIAGNDWNSSSPEYGIVRVRSWMSTP